MTGYWTSKYRLQKVLEPAEERLDRTEPEVMVEMVRPAHRPAEVAAEVVAVVVLMER